MTTEGAYYTQLRPGEVQYAPPAEEPSGSKKGLIVGVLVLLLLVLAGGIAAYFLLRKKNGDKKGDQKCTQDSDCKSDETCTGGNCVQKPVETKTGVYLKDIGTQLFPEAKKQCTLASPSQLLAAWKKGLGVCQGAWLSDGSVQYPMQVATSGCGNKKGLIPEDSSTSGTGKKYNAWCYGQIPAGNAYSREI